jgi:glucokinase
MSAGGALGLVADIGGTNARFAWVDLAAGAPTPQTPLDFKARDYPTVLHALDAYLERAQPPARPSAAVIAVAGPVISGTICFTNSEWSFSEADLRGYGFGAARLINDYAALAYAATALGPGDTRQLGGPADAPQDETLAVVGAGTGFGVSALARDGRGESVVVTEGGHCAFAPCDELELQVLSRLMARFGRVSIERILSGPGLVNLHQALAEVEGRTVESCDPAAITAAAVAGEREAVATVQRFCAIFGSVAGDFALAFGAKRGVYLAGGIAPTLIEQLDGGSFRSRFEDKGRFRAYMQAIPVRVIMRPHVGLIGAAAAMLAR